MRNLSKKLSHLKKSTISVTALILVLLAFVVIGFTPVFESRVQAQQVTALTKPANPTEVSAAGMGPDGVKLSWQDNANDEDGYELWRWETTSGWVFLGTFPADTISYQDPKLIAGATYWYYVAAFNKSGYSEWPYTSITLQSQIVASPSNFRTDTSSAGIGLYWKDNAANEKGYELWRWELSSGWTFLGALPADSNSYQDITLKNGYVYWYYLAAYSSCCYSDWVNISYTPTSIPTPISLRMTGIDRAYIESMRHFECLA